MTAHLLRALAGWRINENSTGELVVSGPDGGITVSEGKGDIARRTLYGLAKSLHAAALSQVETHCYVGDMKTSAGTDYYVCIERNGKRITPHKYAIRGRAEYDVAEWNQVLNDAPKPDLLAYDTVEPDAMLAAAPAAQGVSLGWSAEDACEAFIAAEIDAAPEALRRLGDWLCNVLDEDLHKTASAMVLGAMMETSAAIRAMLAAAPAAQGVAEYGGLSYFAAPAQLHPKTLDLVTRFAGSLAAKLSAAEQKYGYSDGWAESDWLDECRAKLLEHVAKGDPRDVAAYCAFLWHHGARTAAAPAALEVKRDPLIEGLERALPEMDPEEGRWLTCSGCYESEDGHPVGSYPSSALLGCTLGGGCHECGGLGAIWDMTNYADFAELALAQDTATAVVVDEAMTRLAEVLPPRPLPNMDYSYEVSPLHAEQLHIRFAALTAALGQEASR